MTDEFLAHLTAEQRCSSHTVEAYGRDLRQFAEFCSGSAENFDFLLATTGDIREWIGSIAGEGRSATTLRRKIQALRAFYHWANKTGRIHRNPALDVTLPKIKKHLPNFIKVSEMESLLDSLKPNSSDLPDSSCKFNSSDSPYGADKPDGTNYDRARTGFVLNMLYSLGLRQAELLSLTDDDFSATARELRVAGKRNKTRIIPVPDELCREISEWQSVRDARYPDLNSPRPLIAGPHGALSKVSLYNIVKEALDKVSTGRKSPHTLRHTFATALVNDGADLDAVREFLGHESLATTQIYTHLSFKDLLSNYRHSHPRAKNNQE